VSAQDFDVLVLGGGLTGLGFALLLQAQSAGGRAGLRVGMVEAGHAPPAELPAEMGLRVVALSLASRAMLEQCGCWSRLPGARIGPYRRMVVWHHAGAPDGPASITFDAAEEGVAELGYIVENDLLRMFLWRQAESAGSIELITGVAPVGIEVGRDAAQLALAGGRHLRSRLIVGADGHDSWLRTALGVGARQQPYGQQAVVAHVASERLHGETAWQRFQADGPLALLPLPDGRSSIVWSCPEEQAKFLVSAPESAFNQALTAASAGVLGRLRLTTRRLSFPLAAAHASQYTGLRFALIGDAAHRVHPLAGQGVNLGFQDAAALAETLVDHLSSPAADPGDPLALRRYERWRTGANLATLATMDVLHRVFTSRVPGVSRAAGFGLGLANRLSPLKSRLADYALGRRGDLPTVARATRGFGDSGGPGRASGGG
jgi:ubiquinone biosynthesis UbiH/UbiF/VisC/COQ6 family hydroxylase